MNGDIEGVRKALGFIPASDWETWVRIGMAIKSELRAGYRLGRHPRRKHD